MNGPQSRAADVVGRSAALNLAGHALPLLVGLVTIPFIMRRLGLDAFGILSLAWALLGYLGLFDFGLGRATTNAFARDLSQGREHALTRLFWTSLKLSLVLGLLASGLLALLGEWLVGQALKLPAALTGDARATFLILAISLPAVLASTMLRGVLEACSRFDLIAAIRIPASASLFLLPAVALSLDGDLPRIAILLACSNVVWFAAYLFACFRAMPRLRAVQPVDGAIVRLLVAYGGWVTAGNALGPLIVYLDRFLIGALISTAAVAFYAAPYEIVTRLWIFPASLVSALFPLFSVGSAGRLPPREIDTLYARSITYLVLSVGALAVLLIVFADPLLRIWLGPSVAAEAAWALRILAGGVLVNSLAHVPYSLIQALGRPDLVAKLYVVELIAYIGVAWVFIERWGITGAAAAWSLRALADAVVLFAIAARLCPMKWTDFVRGGTIRGVAAVVALAGSMTLGLRLTPSSLASAQIVVTGVLLGCFAWGAWRWVLNFSAVPTVDGRQ
jgi:O-antigen/teichoic acid export membrane protein